MDIKNETKWIFLVGKGGVGKTTFSCSLGILYSTYKKKVLIINTDPGGNMNDFFHQKFNSEPNEVIGYENLWAMESNSDIFDENNFIPGITEVNSLTTFFINSIDNEYDYIIFDTSSINNTIKLLQLPLLFKDYILPNSFIYTFKDLISTYFLGGNDFINLDEIFLMLKTTLHFLFNNTFFICISTADYLSLIELEKIISYLKDNKFFIKYLIINQLLEKNECNTCSIHYNLQQKYLLDIYELYSDLKIIEFQKKIFKDNNLLEIIKELEIYLIK